MNKQKKISEVPYTGPKKTITQSLTTEEIKDLLDGYEKTNFENLKPFYHVRYYHEDKKTGEVLFRTGGIIIKCNNEKKYVVLSSGAVSWSVQKKNNIFYQAIPLSVAKEQLNEQYKDDIQKKNNEIIQLTAYIKTLNTTIANLTNKCNELETTLKHAKKTKNTKS